MGIGKLGRADVWEPLLLGAGAIAVCRAVRREARPRGAAKHRYASGPRPRQPRQVAAGRRDRHRRPQRALRVGQASVQHRDRRASRPGSRACIVNTGLKYAVGRARPEDGLGTTDFEPFKRADASFPSNHTTVMWAAVTPFAKEYDAPWLYGVAALVNAGRIASREHWLSDTVASSLLGYAIGDFFWQERRAQSKGPKVLVGPNTVSLKWETNWEH